MSPVLPRLKASGDPAIVINSHMTSHAYTGTVPLTSSFCCFQSLARTYQLVRTLWVIVVAALLRSLRTRGEVPFIRTGFTGGGSVLIVVGTIFAVHAILQNVAPETTLTTRSTVVRARFGDGTQGASRAGVSASLAVLVPPTRSTGGGRSFVLPSRARSLQVDAGFLGGYAARVVARGAVVTVFQPASSTICS